MKVNSIFSEYMKNCLFFFFQNFLKLLINTSKPIFVVSWSIFESSFYVCKSKIYWVFWEIYWPIKLSTYFPTPFSLVCLILDLTALVHFAWFSRIFHCNHALTYFFQNTSQFYYFSLILFNCPRNSSPKGIGEVAFVWRYIIFGLKTLNQFITHIQERSFCSI